MLVIQILGHTISYPNLRSYNKYRLAFQFQKCVFLGYGSFHKEYKCLHSSGRVYASNHVVFDENSFLHVYGIIFLL